MSVQCDRTVEIIRYGVVVRNFKVFLLKVAAGAGYICTVCRHYGKKEPAKLRLEIIVPYVCLKVAHCRPKLALCGSITPNHIRLLSGKQTCSVLCRMPLFAEEPNLSETKIQFNDEYR